MEKHEFDLGAGQYPEALAVLFDNIVGDDTPAPTVSGEKALEIGMKVAFDLGKSLGPDESIDGIKKAWDTYSELKTTLEGLPSTWYPALIGAMVNAAYSRPVFVPGGASRYIGNLEGRIGKAAAPVPDAEGPTTLVHIKTGSGRNEYPVHRDVRALIDGLMESIRILRDSVNTERAGRIDPELARKTLASIQMAERGMAPLRTDDPGGGIVPVEDGLAAGRKLAEAILAQASKARGPSRVTAEELVAAAATAAISRDVAETAEQPMDATELVVAGLEWIELCAASNTNENPLQLLTLLKGAGEKAREMRLALTGEKA